MNLKQYNDIMFRRAEEDFLTPPEDVGSDVYCERCGQVICEGEAYYDVDVGVGNVTLCRDCLEDFKKFA